MSRALADTHASLHQPLPLSLPLPLPHSPSRFEEEDYEVDSSAFFKVDVGNLANIKNMADALAQYGYTSDDHIERREICKIYACVKQDVEAEIRRLTMRNEYTRAKALRARLVGIRSEFDALQTTEVATSHALQVRVCVYVCIYIYIYIHAYVCDNGCVHRTRGRRF